VANKPRTIVQFTIKYFPLWYLVNNKFHHKSQRTSENNDGDSEEPLHFHSSGSAWHINKEFHDGNCQCYKIVLRGLKTNWPTSRTPSHTSKRNSMMATRKCYSCASLIKEIWPKSSRFADIFQRTENSSHSRITNNTPTITKVVNVHSIKVEAIDQRGISF